MENIRRLVKAALEPDDINVLWVDVSNPQNFVLRLYKNGRWDTAATQAINDPRIFGVDTVPTLNSPNVITSGGVYTAIHSIESAQVQADWNQTDTTAKDYIKNKPTTFGEITEIIMNNNSVPISNGIANLGTVLTEHQSLTNYYTKSEINGLLDNCVYSEDYDSSSEIAVILKDKNGQQKFPVTDKSLVQGLSTELDAKQNTLISGTNIKTINNQSILGEGNITIEGGGGGISQIQSDWQQENSSAVDYIKNKPTIPSVVGLESTTNKVTSWHSTPSDTSYPSEKLVKDTLDSKYVKLSSGIPLTDLASEVQTSIALADTAVQPESGKGLFSGSYTDLTNQPSIPDELADLTEDSTHRTVTDTEKSTWNSKSDFSGNYNDLTNKPTIPDISGKQDTLVSGTNIKTINNESLLGSGNITLSGGSSVAVVDSLDSTSTTSALSANQGKVLKGLVDAITVPTALSDLSDDSTHRLVTDTEKSGWSGKQEALVSGTNIKTINNESLLGSGNITISAGSLTPIEDSLTSTSTTSALSANQGYVLKGLVDNKVSQVSGKDLSDENYTAAEKSKLAGIANGAEVNVQSNWNEDDSSSDAYILNKPTIPSKTSDLTNDSNFVVDASYVHTANNFTTTLKNKLNGIEAGAEVNVNADWNASSGDAQILNKPTIPSKTSDLTNDSGFLTSHQDISGKENTSNKVTSLSSGSTDTQYPSAKCVYDYVAVLEAPNDGNQYVRKNGAWSQLDTTALVNATVNITLTTDSGLNASNLAGTGNNDGAVITIKNASDNSTITTLTWSGTQLTTYITGGITFKISCGTYSGFIAPSDATYTALSGTTINAICTYKDNTPGVYIRYTDGSMSNYDTLTSGKTPVGPALITANQRIVIYPESIAAEVFGDNHAGVFHQVTANPQSDFSGKQHTSEIISTLGTSSGYGTSYLAYTASSTAFADSSEGYMPAAGQLYEMFLNSNNINIAYRTAKNISSGNLVKVASSDEYDVASSTEPSAGNISVISYAVTSPFYALGVNATYEMEEQVITGAKMFSTYSVADF